MANRNAIEAFTLALMLVSGGAFAQATPVGLWKVIDDETKQPLSYVRIDVTGGVLSGRMESCSTHRGRTRSVRSAPTNARTNPCSA